MSRVRRALLSGGTVLLLATQSLAEVERIDIRRREVVADGKSFGLTGPYEKLVGRVWFTLDPEHPANAEIVDLEAAATDGEVTFAADLYVLRPSEPGRGNGTLLLEVPNRGGKAQVWFFDRGAGRSLDPRTVEDFGDALLLRRGFTLAWLGWQWDVPEREGVLRLYPARARGLEGLVRADHVFDRREWVLALGDRNHAAYPVADPADRRNRLTVRDTRLGQRIEIPRSEWRFARLEKGGGVIPDPRSIYLEAGFEPGRIYEAVYVAEDPAVVGLGLAATRDLVSYLKYAGEEIRVDRALGFGISQSGRFLRHLMYQGFNRDEEGRRAFDGIWSHVAGGGRGSFNHRFGQASRDAHSFSAFFFPTDIFPFSGADQLDPVSGIEDGLFGRLDVEDPPKVFFTNSGYEYWGRAASLIHTDIAGRRDLFLEPFTRIWGFAGMQHYTDAFPPRASGTRYEANPSIVQWGMRALLVALEEWVTTGQEPPPSRFARIENGELVGPDDLAFPSVPEVTAPGSAHVAYRVDYGPRFRDQGIVDRQPPTIGAVFPTLVPQVGADGNEIGGLRMPEIAVPVASYTPWNYRSEETGSGGELAGFRGSFFPFQRTDDERRTTGDSRPSLEALYGSRAEYIVQYTDAALELIEEGFLLTEDLPEIIEHGKRLWDLVAR